MPRGRTCAFCELSDEAKQAALAEWRSGTGPGGLRNFLQDKFNVDISFGSLNYCPTASGHYDRGNREETAKKSRDRLGKIADLLERSGIDADDIGKVQSVRLSEWQGLTKDAEGEAQIHKLEGASIVLSPTWDEGPQWPLVDRAAQAPVRLPKSTPSRTDTKTAVILPDVQIGYRRDIDTAELDSFHDEEAMAAALRVVRVAKPTKIIHLGDLLDFAPLGTFEQEAGFALTVQPAIDRAHRWLVECQAAAPDAEQILLEGNHDRRLQKAIVRNNLAAFGVRKANAPDSWPVLSVPYLLRLDELGVEYKGGYPANTYWLNDRCCVIHGHKVRSAGSTAAAVVDDERISVIFGHVHRIEQQHRTRRVRDGHRTSQAASPGCLCKIDGTVPSVKGSTDPLGRPIATAENWQHGVGVVTYEEGDELFTLELVPIHEGKVTFRGKPL